MCLEHKIRQTAYEIWRDQGCPNGRQKEHWLEVEKRVVAAEISQLKDLFRRKQQVLGLRLAEIDARLLKCQRIMAEYFTVCDRLSRIGAQLETLDARPLSLPALPPAAELSEFLRQRVAFLM